MDRKHYYKKAIGVADVEVTPRENASGGGAAPPAAAPKHAGFQHRRIRNGTLAVFFVLLLVLAGVFSAAHFAHIGILHSKSTPKSGAPRIQKIAAIHADSLKLKAGGGSAGAQAGAQAGDKKPISSASLFGGLDAGALAGAAAVKEGGKQRGGAKKPVADDPDAVDVDQDSVDDHVKDIDEDKDSDAHADDGVDADADTHGEGDGGVDADKDADGDQHDAALGERTKSKGKQPDDGDKEHLEGEGAALGALDEEEGQGQGGGAEGEGAEEDEAAAGHGAMDGDGSLEEDYKDEEKQADDDYAAAKAAGSTAGTAAAAGGGAGKAASESEGTKDPAWFNMSAEDYEGAKAKGGAAGGGKAKAAAAAAAGAGAATQQQGAGQGAGAKAVVPAGAATGSPSSTPVVVKGNCGKLTKELLSKYAQNNTVLITFTNELMWRNFGATWLHHVRKSAITYWLLAVADERSAVAVNADGVNQCFMAEENEIDDIHAEFKWGSRSWSLHTWQKVLTVRHVHHLGFSVVNSDIDVIWMRNPLSYFLVKYPDPDYWVSMDPITTANPLGDDGPELGITVHHYMNTGVYFLRQTPGGRALIDKWYEIRKDSQARGFHDQDGLYKFLSTHKEEVNREKRYTLVLEGKTKLAQLSTSLFQNGYSHCINKLHTVHKVLPYETHFVWVSGNNWGKIHRMREQMYYKDPDSYYMGTDYVSIDLDTVETPAGYNEWNVTDNMVEFHLKAMERQLRSMYYGFALAYTLNRTLILPKVICHCIHNWFENPLCRLPGEPHTKFPMICPADYVFIMDKLHALQVRGQRIHIRAYSFLDNRDTPEEIRLKPLEVSAKEGITEAELKGAALTLPLPEGVASVAGLPMSALRAALQPYTGFKNARRLHFHAPKAIWGGFEDPELEKEFNQAMAQLAVKWCCRTDVDIKALHKPRDQQLLIQP